MLIPLKNECLLCCYYRKIGLGVCVLSPIVRDPDWDPIYKSSGCPHFRILDASLEVTLNLDHSPDF